MLDRTVYTILPQDSQELADARFNRAVADVFDLMHSAGLLRQRTETGGVLVHGWDRMFRDGDDIRIAIIGIPERFTPEQSLAVAVEKFERLYDRPGDDQPNLTAWSTRDPSAIPARWGGAIVIDGRILSFSGLSEHADEALIIGAAYLVGWLDREHALAYAAISSNKLVAEILDRMII